MIVTVVFIWEKSIITSAWVRKLTSPTISSRILYVEVGLGQNFVASSMSLKHRVRVTLPPLQYYSVEKLTTNPWFTPIPSGEIQGNLIEDEETQGVITNIFMLGSEMIKQMRAFCDA